MIKIVPMSAGRHATNVNRKADYSTIGKYNSVCLPMSTGKQIIVLLGNIIGSVYQCQQESRLQYY